MQPMRCRETSSCDRCGARTGCGGKYRAMMVEASRTFSESIKIGAQRGTNKIRPVAITYHQHNAKHISPVQCSITTFDGPLSVSKTTVQPICDAIQKATSSDVVAQNYLGLGSQGIRQKLIGSKFLFLHEAYIRSLEYGVALSAPEQDATHL